MEIFSLSMPATHFARFSFIYLPGKYLAIFKIKKLLVV
jgi:hypothetical protein